MAANKKNKAGLAKAPAPAKRAAPAKAPAKKVAPTKALPPKKAEAPAIKPAVKSDAKAVIPPAPKAAPAPKAVAPAPRPMPMPLPRPSLAAQFSGAAQGGNKLPPRLQAVIDQREIEQLIYTQAHALDRGEESLLRSIYHPDATVDMGPGIFQGSVSDYINWVSLVMQQVKSSHTMIGNIRLDIRADEAFGESYFVAQNRLDKATGREDLFLAGRTLDRFERRPTGPAGVWKIVHRKQVLDWVRTEAVADIFYHMNPDALWGSRSKADLSYQLEQFPGGQGSGTSKLPSFIGRRYEGKSIKL
jgi:hypothetical protein